MKDYLLVSQITPGDLKILGNIDVVLLRGKQFVSNWMDTLGRHSKPTETNVENIL